MLDFFVIFLILWWLVLFIILPFGVNRDVNIQYGNDPGAPKKTMLKKKFFLTTLITFFVTLLIIVVKNEIF